VNEDVQIIRGALCQILMNKVPDIEYLFGDSIQGITQFSDRVQVQFKKNAEQEFDFVIGADGLHSNVRHLVFGEESQFSHQLGIYLCVFTVPNYLNLDRIEMQYTEFGRIAAVWSARGEPNAKACFGFTSPTLQIDLNDIPQQQQAIKTIYQGIGWEIPKFLQMMPESEDFYFDTAAQIHIDHLSKGRVALVGDAAYCASPMSGQGASLALIGAYILAGEIVTAKGDYQSAFEKYEKQMRPFIKTNQALGLKAAKRMRSQDKITIQGWLLKQLMRIAPGGFIKFIIKLSTERISKAANSITLKDY
jgi:2-polyprenyl-6-methoxyphenol hydroxylase-like FAD-dependent oxidoreductase